MSLATISNKITVDVKNVKQITENLAVISYTNEKHERQDNLYNVRSAEVMDTLLLVPAGKKVTAVLAPNEGTSDFNGHPDCVAATVVGAEEAPAPEAPVEEETPPAPEAPVETTEEAPAA